MNDYSFIKMKVKIINDKIKDCKHNIFINDEKYRKYKKYILSPIEYYNKKYKKYNYISNQKKQLDISLQQKEIELDTYEILLEQYKFREKHMTPMFSTNSERYELIVKNKFFVKKDISFILNKINLFSNKLSTLELYKNGYNRYIKNQIIIHCTNKLEEVKNNIGVNKTSLISLQKNTLLCLNILYNIPYFYDYYNLFCAIKSLIGLKISNIDFFEVFYFVNLFYYLQLNIKFTYQKLLHKLLQILPFEIVELIFNKCKFSSNDNMNFYIYKISYKKDKYILELDYDSLLEYITENDYNKLHSEIFHKIISVFVDKKKSCKKRIFDMFIFIVYLHIGGCPLYNCRKMFLTKISGNIPFMDFTNILQDTKNICVFNTNISEEVIYNNVNKNLIKPGNDTYQYNYYLNNDILSFFV